VHPAEDLSAYDLVLAPSLYLLTDAAAQALDGHVRGGGALVVGPFSGIVDERDHVRLGGYPGALREVLGVRVEEFFPFAAGQEQALSEGGRGRTWSSCCTSRGPRRSAPGRTDRCPGTPAVTRHARGEGHRLVRRDRPRRRHARRGAGARPDRGGRVRARRRAAGVEVVRRGDRLFVLNHTAEPVSVHGTTVDGGGAAVISPGPGVA
jgi:beta-galactosidase